MKGFIFFIVALLVSNKIKWSNGELFSVIPGDGEEFVYSPVHVNATLHCAVNNSNLLWSINEKTYDRSDSTVSSRGIFVMTYTPSIGITASYMKVFGSVSLNSNISICCSSVEGLVVKHACTTLIIYDRPSPPQNASAQYNKGSGLIIISWTAAVVMGVDQNYTVVFDTYSFETTQLYLIIQQNTSDIHCSAYIIAVNGAGESDPSNNVSIPSLPNIGSVTASLTHQVWKHNGEISVNISFQSAKYCLEYPVLSYLVVLRLKQTENFINVSLGINETEITLYPQDGLKNNQKYMYSVNALNSVGIATTNENNLCTSDVQAVSATAVDESTIDIQCWFIHGSDALGCKVVLISNHLGINNEIRTFSRNKIYASGIMILAHPVSCYLRVVAFDIESDNTISSIAIEGELINRRDNVCSGSDQVANAIAVPLAVSSLIILVILIIVAAVIAFAKLRWKKNNGFESQQEAGGASMEPEYDEISQPKVLNENFEIEENVAYGQVVSTGRQR